MSLLLAVFLLVVAYLLGSICSAIVVCKLLGLPDPRSQGSNNPGATNVMRIGGKGPALLTLAGDMFKGVPTLLVAQSLGLDAAWLGAIAFAAFLGHLYPIFFRFQGGKGVATALGVLLALYWPLGLAVIGIWLAVFAVSRISSLSSLIAFASAPALTAFWLPSAFPSMLAMSLVLMARHHANIRALLRGEEKSFKQKQQDISSNTDAP